MTWRPQGGDWGFMEALGDTGLPWSQTQAASARCPLARFLRGRQGGRDRERERERRLTRTTFSNNARNFQFQILHAKSVNCDVQQESRAWRENWVVWRRPREHLASGAGLDREMSSTSFAFRHIVCVYMYSGKAFWGPCSSIRKKSHRTVERGQSFQGIRPINCNWKIAPMPRLTCS